MTMHSDDRDNLDNLPSLSLPHDDVMERAMASQLDATKKAGRDRNGEKGTFFFGTGSFLVLLGLLIVVGGLGFFQTNQLQQTVESTQDRVAVAEKRLSDVSGTVTETGQTLSQSDQQVKSELKELNFEIRKLWTLANNRNRNDIDSLTKQLVDHDASLKMLKVLGDNAVGQTKKHSDALNKTVSRLEKIESQLKDFSADMATSLLVSRETADKLTKAVNDLQRDTMNALRDVKSIRTKADQQLASMEEASRSMDSYRLQMNKRLLQLEDSVRQVQESNNGAGLTPNSEGYDL